MQEYGSVSAGPGGWCRTFSSLKSPELMYLHGAEAKLQSCASAGWGPPTPPPPF